MQKDTAESPKKKKKKKIVHPLDESKRVNMGAAQPLKNIDRQLAVVQSIQKNNAESNKELLVQAGYSPSYSEKVNQVLKKRSFAQLLEEKLPDHKVLDQHNALMVSRKLEHMVFPTSLDDDEIVELLVDVNCIVRKIVHGEQAKHVYFWAQDNKAIKDALDMVYKLKGKYKPEADPMVSTYQNLTTAELMERRKKAIAFYKKKPPEKPK